MNYIVVDLEWNQAMSSKSSVFNKLPIKLRGEIIEIGAVKLTDDMKPAEEFTVDVKPVYFKRMHYKVKKLTGFDKERLALGLSFRDAFEQFRSWCGENPVFLTWGCDDKGIMEQNIIIHDLDWDWIGGWINLQLIYNMQTDGDKNQKSLATAMEHFGIEQTRVAHDALGDAYNTALVASHLDMYAGLAQYDDASRILATPKPGNHEGDGPEAIEHLVFNDYVTKADAFADPKLTTIPCPKCGGSTALQHWVNQGDQRYMNIYTCEVCTPYLVRLKFRKHDDNLWSANRLIYEANDEMLDFYRTKAALSRRRGRGHTAKKNRPANKE
ncbi:MAG: 3'-5' exonuclease [Bacillota bacterium]|nr:3'-5' exonuclease [Bacillota bacterium]